MKQKHYKLVLFCLPFLSYIITWLLFQEEFMVEDNYRQLFFNKITVYVIKGCFIGMWFCMVKLVKDITMVLKISSIHLLFNLFIFILMCTTTLPEMLFQFLTSYVEIPFEMIGIQCMTMIFVFLNPKH